MTIKDAIIAVREVCLIAIFLTPLLFPTWSHERLEKLGITKINVGFAELEMEREIKKSREEVAQAKERANTAEAELSEISSKLEQLTKNPKLSQSAYLKNEVSSLKNQVDRSAVDLRRFDRELEKSLDRHEILIEKMGTVKDNN